MIIDQANLIASPPEAKTNFSFRDASNIARCFARYLKTKCDRFIFAGSLRRQKAIVNDIEILYIPSFASEPDPLDLFGSMAKVNTTDRALEALLAAGILAKRPNKNGALTWGDKNKLAIHLESGIGIDFFSATPSNYFNYLVCRTGGSETNVSICQAAIKIGWKWNPYGEGFSRVNPNEIHSCETERAVFDFVGLEYREPWERA